MNKNNMEFEGKPIIVNGRDDEQFVNDRIRELREKRNNLQDRIYDLSKQLKQLEEERDNAQKEIDQEFLKQEHAYDLVRKYIQCDNKIYFVTDVDRLFNGIKIFSNWYCDPEHKLIYINSNKGKHLRSISFEILNAILSGKDENVKFISEEKALEIMNQIIKEKTIRL